MSGRTGSAAATRGGNARHVDGRYENHRLTCAIASASSTARLSPHPDTVACMRAPPISSSVAISPITISAMRGEPRYIDALPSTITTMSQKLGMYAPPAADGPNRQHACGTLPERRTWLAKMRPAPRRPGNSSTWSVMRAPAESTSQNDGQLVGERPLGEADDLLDGARAPRTRLHRRVVGHHAHRPAVDRADAGDDAIGGQVVGRRQRVREQPVLDERALVEQQVEPIAHEELVLGRELVALGSRGCLRERGRLGAGGRPSARVHHDRRRTRSFTGVLPRSRSSRRRPSRYRR